MCPIRTHSRHTSCLAQFGSINASHKSRGSEAQVGHCRVRGPLRRGPRGRDVRVPSRGSSLRPSPPRVEGVQTRGGRLGGFLDLRDRGSRPLVGGPLSRPCDTPRTSRPPRLCRGGPYEAPSGKSVVYTGGGTRVVSDGSGGRESSFPQSWTGLTLPAPLFSRQLLTLPGSPEAGWTGRDRGAEGRGVGYWGPCPDYTCLRGSLRVNVQTRSPI